MALLFLPFAMTCTVYGHQGDRQIGRQTVISQAQQVIQNSRDSKNLSDFLATLPKALFRNSMLNIASRSTQPGTIAEPRVILFDGHFTLAYTGFNGGTRSVELMEFQPSSGDYDFYRLTFTSRELIAEKNPEVCKVCHGQSLRPIWTTMMMIPWFNGFAGIGDITFRERENELLKEFIRKNRRNPLYAQVLSFLKSVESPSRYFFDNNVAYEAILDDEMPFFTANHLARHPMFNQLVTPLLAVLSGRIDSYVAGSPREPLDFAARLAPLLQVDASVLRQKLDSRSEQMQKKLVDLQIKKLNMHWAALRSTPSVPHEPYIMADPTVLASLHLVLEHFEAGHLMDELFSLGLRGEDPDLLGVNLNPWFYPGKLERELLRMAAERIGFDATPYRKMVTENFKPNPISFSVWQTRESADVALNQIHSRLTCDLSLR